MDASRRLKLEDGAFRLLGRREHSRWELRRKLLHRKWLPGEVDEVLDGLEDQGLLSDARFARAWIRHRAGRGLGPIRIRGELRQRGVEAAVVVEAFHAVEEEGEVDWQEVAERWVRRKWGSSIPSGVQERARRLKTFLARGFAREDFPAV